MNYKSIIKSRETRLRILKFLDFIPDKWMIKLQYKIKTGRRLNLRNPKRYNEKLQWYKLYYRNPLMPKCTDKYLVREYIKEKGLEEILIPLYGVYDSPDEIKFGKLPSEYVMKTNNGGGSNSVIIQSEENKVSESYIKESLKKWLTEWTVKAGREWNYYNIKKKIICEKYIKDNSEYGLIDYKFYCFDGKPEYSKVTYTDSDTGKLVQGIFDIDFNLLPYVRNEVIKMGTPIKRPENYDRMLEIAKTLSEDFPHVRVDLYNIEGKIYFGELTFFDTSGYQIFTPDEFDYTLGNLFKLRNIKS